jgi:LuxR family maltose regulon positive regulatory protein
MQPATASWAREEAAAQQIRVALALGQPAEAEAAFKPPGPAQPDRFAIPGLAPGQSITYLAGLAHNSALRILLHQAEPAGLRHGIEIADRVISGALQGQYLPLAIEALLLRARMHFVLGNQPAGLAGVARALELAEPEGLISLFVEAGPPIAEILARPDLPGATSPEYVQRILAAFPASQAAAPKAPEPPGEVELAALIEPLSQREMEILRLICEGCSNQEVAARLVLSPHTVKKHTSNIFSKLGVSSRTQAVARARQLRLL